MNYPHSYPYPNAFYGYGYGYDYPYSQPYRNRPYAYGCCKPLVKRVTCVEHCDDKVVFAITGLFSELAQNNCFRLELCMNTLENNSELPVYLTDGCEIFPLIEGCSGNIVHYAQMVELLNHRKCGCRRSVELDCFYGNDGAPGNVLHVVCNSRLPRTTFVAMPHPTV